MTLADSAITGETATPAQGANTPDANLADAERRAQILSDYAARLRESSAHRKDWIEEARSLYDMAAGRQWDDDDVKYLEDRDRPMVTFNVSSKYMDALTGLQINNRQDIKFAPREPGDVRVNEILTGAVSWGRDLSGMSDDETDAFYDCILTGEGWMEAYVSRDLDPSGVPCGERVDPLEMYPDPVARRRNYEDARYLIRIKWVSDEDFEELVKSIPGGMEGEASDTGASMVEDDSVDATQFIETPHDYGTSTGGSNSKRRKPIADYQWYEREDALIVEAPGLPTKMMTPADWKAVQAQAQKVMAEAKALQDRGEQLPPELAPALQQLAPIAQAKVTPTRRKCYYRAIIAQNQIVKQGKNSNRDGFTFQGITGKRDRNKRYWYGIGRNLVDPQKWVNKFFSTILYVLMTNAKGGIMAEENTFTDARKAEDTWASANSIIHLKEGALQKGKIEPKPPANYPQGMDRLMEFSLNALPQTSGINLELLGLADRVQAGVVEAQRKQSAMAIVAWAFDGMRRYYRNMGRLLAEYVKDYMSEGTLIQITGQQGKQYVPLVKAQLNANFDVIVDEAPTSVNQQERVWGVLQSIIPQLLQAGMAIPPTVLQYAPLPQDLKDDWSKALQPDPQKQQIQAATVQATLQKILAEVQASSSKSKLDESSAGLNNAKAAEIMHAIQQPAAPGEPDPHIALAAELQAQLQQKEMELAVEQRIAELKADKEAETKILMVQLQTDSAEKIALLQSTIDARLEAMRIASDERAAALAAQQSAEQANSAERQTAATAKSHEALAGAISGMTEVVRQVGKPKKIKRNGSGDIVGVE